MDGATQKNGFLVTKYSARFFTISEDQEVFVPIERPIALRSECTARERLGRIIRSQSRRRAILQTACGRKSGDIFIGKITSEFSVACSFLHRFHQVSPPSFFNIMIIALYVPQINPAEIKTLSISCHIIIPSAVPETRKYGLVLREALHDQNQDR